MKDENTKNQEKNILTKKSIDVQDFICIKCIYELSVCPVLNDSVNVIVTICLEDITLARVSYSEDMHIGIIYI